MLYIALFNNNHSKPAQREAEQQLIMFCAKRLPLAPLCHHACSLVTNEVWPENLHNLPKRASRQTN